MKKFDQYEWLFLWTIHWLFVVNANQQMRYNGHCYLKNKPIVKLLYDPIVSSYSQHDEEEDHQQVRFLQQSSLTSSFGWWTNPQQTQQLRQDAIRVKNDPPLLQQQQQQQQQQQRQLTINTSTTNNNTNASSSSLQPDEFVYVRECSCVTDSQYPKYTYYCPLELGVCFIPRCLSEECLWPPSCFNQANMSDMFVRSIWPVVVVMFTLLITFLLCTQPGKFAIMYWCTFCIPSLNHMAVRWMLRRRPDQAHAMIRDWVLRHRQHIMEQFDNNNNNDNTNNHHQDVSMSQAEQDLLRDLQLHGRPSLVLKTRIYQSTITTTTNTTKEDDIMLQHQEEGDNKKESNDYNNEENQDMTPTSNHEASFHSLDDDLDDDQLALDSCTICFGPLQTGDRVGNLPCHHTFHVDCLKVWLKKRAVCPLCLRTDVVVRRSGTSTTVDASSQSHNTSIITGLNASSSSNNNNTTTSTLFAHTVSAEEDFERSGAAHPHNAPNM